MFLEMHVSCLQVFTGTTTCKTLHFMIYWNGLMFPEVEPQVWMVVEWVQVTMNLQTEAAGMMVAVVVVEALVVFLEAAVVGAPDL